MPELPMAIGITCFQLNGQNLTHISGTWSWNKDHWPQHEMVKN